MNNKEYKIFYKTIGREELNEQELMLENIALDAAMKAYAPYSKFNVGAAILLDNGEIISGSNQENAAYPSGTCAERTAIFYANSKFPNVGIKTIVILAVNAQGRVDHISPCGACRQVLMEASVRYHPFKVLLCGKEEIIVLEDSRELLPFGFDGSELH